jgi:hypothetical protein
MPSTTIEYTKAAQDKTLEAIKQGQSVIVEAVAAWAKAAEKTIPAIPAVPGAAELPTPDEVVKTSFDFYGDVLAAQRKFANDLIAASAPVIKAPKAS